MKLLTVYDRHPSRGGRTIADVVVLDDFDSGENAQPPVLRLFYRATTPLTAIEDLEVVLEREGAEKATPRRRAAIRAALGDEAVSTDMETQRILRRRAEQATGLTFGHGNQIQRILEDLESES